MSKKILHKASTRGHANHGWLDTWHTFSFADYYDPERVHFGMLRVLNDDTIAPGMGFPTHPHDNMEIVSIPLEGALEHRDSMGNVSVIRKGEVQIMSAGTGITHSEYNKLDDRLTKFLQIWVFPDQRGLTPRYGQIKLDAKKMKNSLLQIVSPSEEDEGVMIHQRAWFHIGDLDKGAKTEYKLKDNANGVYAFVLKGEVDIDGEKLRARDGIGIWDAGSIAIEAVMPSEVLLMEVPMR